MSRRDFLNNYGDLFLQGGLTALFTTAEMGNTDVMNVLIDMGANVNHINKVRQDMKASNKASNFIGVP